MALGAGPTGLKMDRDHALTGAASSCRLFEPELKAAKALWLSLHVHFMISILP
ncbi:MAG: hypothetical protein QOH41_1633 [Blastocatellia bacterium]|jgi:hypothetical protein|nr:hypothetical protein [Blastocatellia bacterium]